MEETDLESDLSKENASGDKAVLLSTEGEYPALSLMHPTVRLLGRNPQEGERRLAEKFLEEHSPTGSMVVYGLGLGYHIEELINIGAIEEIEILEVSLPIIAAAFWSRDLSYILKSKKIRISAGKDALEKIRLINPKDDHDSPIKDRIDTDSTKKIILNDNTHIEKENLLIAPYAKRHFSQEYALTNSTHANARQVLQVKGKRILFFQTSYFLDRDLRVAADKLGCVRESWNIEDYKDLTKDREEDFRRLLNKIKDFNPHLVLTVNHLGFDTEGILSSILARLGIPCASYFVDSPWYILKGAKLNSYQGLTAFSWDSDYLEILLALGFSNVRYLPLATEDSFFKEVRGKTPHLRDLAFVGDSLETATKKYLALSGLKDDILPLVDQVASEFLLDSQTLPDSLLIKQKQFALLNDYQFLNLSALVTWRASRLHRVAALSALTKFPLVIAGDKGWEELFPKVTLHKTLDYYDELPGFYRATKINLNITSAQMKTGLNQRVFDAPSTGSFLLTDRRAQLYEIFQEGKSVVSYENMEELPEKVSYYLKHDSERDRITTKAREIINSSHLYSHRLKTIVETTLRG
ncbi:MAG: glycosyltransferase [Deltaproteobacteria bacterium]|nr:glycosyltransferase [Deltaproteobacteria bacterium]